MKNITLSAPEELIEQVRKNAVAKGTTLNSEFRAWLESQTTSGEERLAQHKQLMKRLSRVNAGRKFTRREMNER
jgi:stress-induced morphogen